MKYVYIYICEPNLNVHKNFYHYIQLNKCEQRVCVIFNDTQNKPRCMLHTKLIPEHRYILFIYFLISDDLTEVNVSPLIIHLNGLTKKR